MKFCTLLLAGAALPLTLAFPASAADPANDNRAGLVVAQAETPPECPEGAECPPVEAAAPDAAGDSGREVVEEASPAEPQQAADPQPLAPQAATPPDEAHSAPGASGSDGREGGAIERAKRRRQELQQRQQTAEPAAEPETPAVEPETLEPAPAPQVVPAARAEPVTPEPAPASQADTAETLVETPAESAQSAPVAEQPEAGANNSSEGSAIERPQRRRDALRQREENGQGERRQPAEPQPTAESTPPPAASAPDATVEQQLEAQGDKAEAESVRNLRKQLLDQLQGVRSVPPSEDAQSPDGARRGGAQDARDPRNQPDRGDRRRRQGNRLYDRDENRGDVVEQRGGRIIIDLGGGNIRVEPVVPDEGGRLLYGARDVDVQRLPGGNTRAVVYRRDGSQIITVRNRYGDLVRRTRQLPNGRKIVLIDNRYDDGRPRPILRDLRRPRVNIPQERYIVDLGRASRDDIRRALLAPPVERIERAYTLDEVLRNEEVRAYSPRIDLDTITFEFGSATIGPDEMPALLLLGEVMEQVIAENPDEVYLLEGHTDAVGSDYDNLILSDRRAETVAVALSQNFYIPPENLITEGYGEQYLKVPTEAPERRNRRATVRRLTDLMQRQN